MANKEEELIKELDKLRKSLKPCATGPHYPGKIIGEVTSEKQRCINYLAEPGQPDIYDTVFKVLAECSNCNAHFTYTEIKGHYCTDSLEVSYMKQEQVKKNKK